MISADSAMDQAQVYGSVNTQMESRARNLQGEIRQDKTRGIDVEKKETELARVEKRAANATASQISTLGTANTEMTQARKTEQEEDKAKNIKMKHSSQEKQMEVFGTVKRKNTTGAESAIGKAQVIGNQGSLNISM